MNQLNLLYSRAVYYFKGQIDKDLIINDGIDVDPFELLINIYNYLNKKNFNQEAWDQ